MHSVFSFCKYTDTQAVAGIEKELGYIQNVNGDISG